MARSSVVRVITSRAHGICPTRSVLSVSLWRAEAQVAAISLQICTQKLCAHVTPAAHVCSHGCAWASQVQPGVLEDSKSKKGCWGVRSGLCHSRPGQAGREAPLEDLSPLHHTPTRGQAAQEMLERALSFPGQVGGTLCPPGVSASPSFLCHSGHTSGDQPPARGPGASAEGRHRGGAASGLGVNSRNPWLPVPVPCVGRPGSRGLGRGPFCLSAGIPPALGCGDRAPAFVWRLPVTVGIQVSPFTRTPVPLGQGPTDSNVTSS